MSLLVHSATKVGKSTLANTSPAPRLLLDAEMAYRFLPGSKCFWNPITEPPPTPGQGRFYPDKPDIYSFDWETCVVILRDYDTMIRAYDWLNQGAHPFRSVNIDSISEVQTRCKDQLTDSVGRMDFEKWGLLLDHMAKLVRGFRDLTEHPFHPIEAITLTAMTHQSDGKWRPYVQGQLKTIMPYFLDVIGYLYVDQIRESEDPTQQSKEIRRLLVTPHPLFEAGERVQGRLGAFVDEPTVEGMLTQVFGPEMEYAA